mgnify:CR=1 FL=1
MSDYNEIKFGENEEYNVTFKFDTPKTGNGQYGEWNLYGVEHDGKDSSFFAPPGLHNRVKLFKQGDSVKIIKLERNGKTFWDVQKTGESAAFTELDARTKDIHRQVCLKLAVESIGTKAKVTDSYYEDVRNRMNGLIMVLDPVEAIKDKFEGEELPDKKLPF